jgi:hypothetical protein
MTRKVFALPAEAPWAPATIVIAETCQECRDAEPVLIWNRAYAVCEACAARWQASIERKRREARHGDQDR